ncbi:peptidoglycan-binding domain-containing protein [Roseisalinus antarcticus]|uniref:Peptidoglycan binding domain protein n=1 Tax=Roseisalinus antarcticus TaxID=254357 RepID=A0A1Y5TJP7_9RHOB|nr:peptidoglycan-binding domain-containing protein [Roseisalinus antarcticus]SLN65708.1 hypothetical protein ROA7023_03092 [Roseisalinus antarcticus]
MKRLALILALVTGGLGPAISAAQEVEQVLDDLNGPITNRLLRPIEIQVGLATSGYDVGPIDGLITVRTRNAIADFASEEGLRFNGHSISRELNIAIRGHYNLLWADGCTEVC